MSFLSSTLLLIIISAVVTGAWAPWLIDKLYGAGLRRKLEKHKPIFRYLQKEKTGVPSMGGLLVIVSVSVLTLLYGLLIVPLTPSIWVLLITMWLFAFLGGIDDMKKLWFVVANFWGLRRRHILLVQFTLALGLGYLLYTWLGLSTITIPVSGTPLELNNLYILYAAILIVATSNSFNITDGIDGLSAGLLIIALLAMLIISISFGFVDLTWFSAIWVGSLLVYLYFNITPARFMMGDIGAQPFGAMLATLSLIMDQSLVMLVLGGMFFVESGSSFAQIVSRNIRNGKKILTIAPLHYHFQVKRWSEGKICMRFWLAGVFFALCGLMLAFW